MRTGARAAVFVPILTRRRAPRPERAGEDPVPTWGLRTPQARLEEAIGLAGAIDLEIVAQAHFPVPTPRPATLIGTGKLEELAGIVAEREIELVVIDHPLTPVQQRNLEKALKAKVLDRTGLILEIFGRRARTKEGRLQVELAHLMFQKSRLVRSWTHLERQRGGFGFLGGPGETQIEADRRAIQERIEGIERDLATVVRTRELHRKGRARVPYPIVALVGYTNAGKSTLFNTLTGSGVYARDQLFATLDPTMRELALPHGRRIILSDTVGFISELPTTLVAAFRATLEEVIAADLILHVRDISHPDSEAQARDVEHVLADLGIDPRHASAPVLEVWNKADLVDADRAAGLVSAAERQPRRPAIVSALTGDGIAGLLARIEEVVAAGQPILTVVVPPEAGALRGWLHANTEVLSHETGEDGASVYRVSVPAERHDLLLRRIAATPGARVVD
ncbi:MAG: GTPase HflX [Rhizobiales bacterium]|nr:GTPase HflX [Hyphomicrobiales bacterium]